MSKSLGNFFTVRDLLDRGISGEVIRFVLLSTHYRQPMDWTEAKVHEATTVLTLWEKLLRDVRRVGLTAPEGTGPAKEVVEALADDLNTPLALKALRELVSEVRANGKRSAAALGEFRASLSLMGITPDGFRQSAIRQSLERAFADVGGSDEDSFNRRIAGLLGEREKARAARDFPRADAIRDGLTAAGIKVMDRPGGPASGSSGRTSIPRSSTGSRHDPRAALPLRHHAPRRAAEPGRGLLGRGQGPDRAGARRARDRLCRGGLAGGQPDRQRVLRGGAGARRARGWRRSG